MKSAAAVAGLLLLLSGTAALAAPATYKKSEPDPRGVVAYWVKCEDGNVAVTQCLRDEGRCGKSWDLSLASAAVEACQGIHGLVMEPVRK